MVWCQREDVKEEEAVEEEFVKCDPRRSGTGLQQSMHRDSTEHTLSDTTKRELIVVTYDYPMLKVLINLTLPLVSVEDITTQLALPNLWTVFQV